MDRMLMQIELTVIAGDQESYRMSAQWIFKKKKNIARQVQFSDKRIRTTSISISTPSTFIF